MEQTSDPLTGRVLDGRYRVGPRIARGGMAVVHQATDLRLDRQVAVKIMHPGLVDDPEFVRRFEGEARAAARLAHPHAVAVFDQGDDHGTLYLVMEHIRGTTLRELIRAEAPLAPQRAMALLEPVLAALASAHRAGMIHRDVKPENVLIGDDGGVKVVDFGLARAVNSESQHTAAGGVLIGTVSYLSPELLVDGTADPRADVYAAGVLLFEMLTGRKPHQADSPVQVAYKHVHEDIPPPSADVRGLPAYVDALVARATARDSSLRPADAQVLLHHVRRVHSALSHGVRDDPDLTADLTPALSRTAAEGELPSRIIDPSDPSDTDGFGAYAGMFDPPEGSWFAPEPQPYRPGPGGRGSYADDGHTRSVPVPPRLAPEPPRTHPHRQHGRHRQHHQRSRRVRRTRALAALLLALLVVGGLAAWWLASARWTTTPGLIDLPQVAARGRAESAGLHLVVRRQAFSESVARGAVIRTDPAAGDRITKGGTVTAVLSRGPERHDVPDVRGQSVDLAQAALQDAHLSYGTSHEAFSEDVPQGQVIGTTPKTGSPLRRGTPVDLTVSKGRRPIPVPDLTGQPADQARSRLMDLGFTVDDSNRPYSDAVPRGHVVAQDPSGGTLFHGDTVSLVVSQGRELVAVPDVRRMSAGDAEAALRAAGLVPRRQESALYIGLDRVAGTDPSPGAQVPRNTTVVLKLL